MKSNLENISYNNNDIASPNDNFYIVWADEPDSASKSPSWTSGQEKVFKAGVAGLVVFGVGIAGYQVANTTQITPSTFAAKKSTSNNSNSNSGQNNSNGSNGSKASGTTVTSDDGASGDALATVVSDITINKMEGQQSATPPTSSSASKSSSHNGKGNKNKAKKGRKRKSRKPRKRSRRRGRKRKGQRIIWRWHYYKYRQGSRPRYRHVRRNRRKQNQANAHRLNQQRSQKPYLIMKGTANAKH